MNNYAYDDVIDDNTQNRGGCFSIETISPRVAVRVARYAEERETNMLTDMVDMRFNAIIASRAMASQFKISGMAAQAGTAMPAEQAKFQAIADKHFQRLIDILDRD